jgi:predicted O-methyltransferase YrrM
MGNAFDYRYSGSNGSCFLNVALKVLLELYEQRADLREVYPEVRNGDFRRLIDWASGASTQKWKDLAHSILQPYADWYMQNSTGTVGPTPWATLNQTSGRSANPIPVTLSVMQDDSSNDINQHLVTLSMLVIEFGLKQIVELGTRNGASTLALLEAASKIGGHVMSIDIEPCDVAKRRVAEAGFACLWEFLQADDLEVETVRIPETIDLLLIDTNHLYAQTIAELKKYGAHLKTGSWIALHDYVSFPGVARAVDEFVGSLAKKARFYPFLHKNGLSMVRM